ncbi:MAG: ribokinase [Hyphomicrobiales bacterium]|nr:MAG: ribokinase [Hyphomicrobiales bacterium]
MSKSTSVAILGVFVADTAYRAERQPQMGETILGSSFVLGPGGKGSNQSVAAGRLGADITFITKLGFDDFADMAFKTWKEAGVKTAVTQTKDSYTGAAYIFIDDNTGDNAIIVCPGAASTISPADIDAVEHVIANAAVFITQLEQPLDAAIRALEIARANKVATILNPAPAAPLPDEVFGLCDYMTPNETETTDITGVPVETLDQARAASDVLLKKGVGTAIITLGEQGVLVHNKDMSEHVPAFNAGPVVETTGAGDAFNGAFATALAEGMNPIDAARFGCATAGISVTRPGTAPSMPSRDEVLALLAKS